MKSGYHQFRRRKEDIPKEAFRTKYEQFEFVLIHFGLTEAPECFQTLISNIFHTYLGEVLLLCIDYLLVYDKNEDDHIKHLRKVFDLLKATVYMKSSKCDLFIKKVYYYGHIISNNGIRVDPNKINIIKE